MPRPNAALPTFALVLFLPGCRAPQTSTPPPGTHGVVNGTRTATADDRSDDTKCGGEPLTVTFYDAGQALAALVTLPDERRILVDVGEDPRRAGCKKTVCGAWNQRVVDGVIADLDGDVVDLLWITHQHSDHHGGLPSLAATPGFRVANYVDNGTRASSTGVTGARTAATAAWAALREVYPGHTAIPIPNAADVELSAVVPAAWPVSNCDDDPNDCSIGLMIKYCRSSILFTGDAETLAEGVWPINDISLLQVGHHGSNTSSSQPFIDALKPEYAVISSGKRDEGTNKGYCHPIKSTVDRLTAATGGAGARTVEVYDASVRKCSKQQAADWKPVAISDNMWLTAFDGSVTLVTTGDGKFVRAQEDGDDARRNVTPVSSDAAAAAKPATTAEMATTKKAIIEESISEYDGSCPCPYHTMSNGRRCGGASAWSRDAGEAPLCYADDVTQEMVDEFLSRRP